ncbi:MAG: hypothetical protein GXP47_11750 [Acidobacteria bacterium]|nr:hypothetical protein [Acidobacteriota bacterium]
MCRRIGFTVSMVAAVIIATPVHAQLVMGGTVIPVVARLHGKQGTFWKSDLSITNAGSTPSTVKAVFLRERTANAAPLSFPKKVTIPAGGTLLVEDVLGSWFPSEGDTKGWLLLLEETGEGRLAINSRTFNAADPRGTYGQTVPGGLFNMLFGLGRAVITGARNDGSFRTDIGVVNLGPVTLKVRIVISDSTGSSLGETSKTVEKFSLRQWNLSDLGVASVPAGSSVVVTIDHGTTGFNQCDPGELLLSSVGIVYASTVDNGTGDAVFSLAQLDWSDYGESCGSSPDEGCTPTAADAVHSLVGF